MSTYDFWVREHSSKHKQTVSSSTYFGLMNREKISKHLVLRLHSDQRWTADLCGILRLHLSKKLPSVKKRSDSVYSAGTTERKIK